MKKILFLILTLLSFSCLFAQEDKEESHFTDGLCFSSYSIMQSAKGGGGFALDIPLFNINKIIAHNSFSFNFYFPNIQDPNGILLTLGEQIELGFLYNSNGFTFRHYICTQAEVGASCDINHGMFAKSPFTFGINGFTGFEFIFLPKKSFYVEFGGGIVLLDWGKESIKNIASGCFSGGYTSFVVGLKNYF